jgi:hypothetical protein
MKLQFLSAPLLYISQADLALIHIQSPRLTHIPAQDAFDAAVFTT